MLGAAADHGEQPATQAEPVRQRKRIVPTIVSSSASAQGKTNETAPATPKTRRRIVAQPVVAMEKSATTNKVPKTTSTPSSRLPPPVSDTASPFVVTTSGPAPVAASFTNYNSSTSSRTSSMADSTEINDTVNMLGSFASSDCATPKDARKMPGTKPNALFSVRYNRIHINERKVDLTRLRRVLQCELDFLRRYDQCHTIDSISALSLTNEFSMIIAAHVQDSPLLEPIAIAEQILRTILSPTGFVDDELARYETYKNTHMDNIAKYITTIATRVDYGRQISTSSANQSKDGSPSGDATTKVNMSIYRWEVNNLENFFDADIVDVLRSRREVRETVRRDLNAIAAPVGDLTQALQKQLESQKKDNLQEEKKRKREEVQLKRQREKEEKLKLKELEKEEKQKAKEQKEQEREERRKKKEQEKQLLLEKQEELKRKQQAVKEVKEVETKKIPSGQQQIVGFFTTISRSEESTDTKAPRRKRNDWFLPFYVRKGVTVASTNHFHPELDQLRSIQAILERSDEEMLTKVRKAEYEEMIKTYKAKVDTNFPKPEDDFESLRKSVLQQFKIRGRERRFQERENEIQRIRRFLNNDGDSQSGDDDVLILNDTRRPNSEKRCDSSEIKDKVDMMDDDMEDEFTVGGDVSDDVMVVDDHMDTIQEGVPPVLESTYPISTLLSKKFRLIKFDESVRPAYWGTWTKQRSVVNGRKPFGKEEALDYEVESDLEWDEEEPGNDIDSEDEDDDDNVEAQSIGSEQHEFDDWLVGQDEEDETGGDEDDEENDDEEEDEDGTRKKKRAKRDLPETDPKSLSDAPRWGVRKRLVPVILGPKLFSKDTPSKSIYPLITGESLVINVDPFREYINEQKSGNIAVTLPELRVINSIDPTIDYHGIMQQTLLRQLIVTPAIEQKEEDTQEKCQV